MFFDTIVCLPINILYCHYNLGKADCFLPRIYGEAKFRIWSQKIVKAPTLPLRHYYWSAWLSFLSKVRGTVLLSQLERDSFKGRRRSRFNPTPTDRLERYLVMKGRNKKEILRAVPLMHKKWLGGGKRKNPRMPKAGRRVNNQSSSGRP